MSPEERYRSDAMFKSCVDTMYRLIADHQMTPSELREAAILAATKYDLEHARKFIFAVEAPDGQA